jgi:excisionase family DNA binding protein
MIDTDPAAPRWATLAEAEAYSRVPQSTLRRWIAAGRLPATRVGPRKIQVDLNEVDKLRTPITPPPPPQET